MTTVITLLTRPDCALCAHAKRVLDRVGAEHPLRVDEVNLDSSHGQQLAARSGVMFAPGILLDGQPYAFGRLSEKALRRDLSRRAQTTEPVTTPEEK